jgi:phage terminase Nu1 subunit (DNA packaging protein)
MGVHTETVKSWVRAGCPVAQRGGRGRPSLYRESDVRDWLEQRDQARQTKARALEQARARLAHAQARLAEQKVKIQQGELVHAHDVERRWNQSVTAVRAALLNTPAAYADRIYRAFTVDGRAGVARELEVMAREVLRELSDEPSGNDVQ